MEALSELPVIGAVVFYVVPFLIVLGIVVFVHEYGHYIVGRWCGIRAEVFSIGFGPRLLGWRDRRGTEWQVAALPLGGYVRFVGDMDPASAGRLDDANLSQSERREAFHNAALWRRAATVAAGPAFNFALSILLFACLALALGAASDDPVIGEIGEDAPPGVTFEPGDRVLSVGGEPVEDFSGIISRLRAADGEPVEAVVDRDGERVALEVAYETEAVAELVQPGMPASRAGMVSGDVILALNGREVDSFRDIQRVTAELPPEAPIEVRIRRDGEVMTLTVEPVVREREHPVTGETQPTATLGISALSTGEIEPTREGIGPIRALGAGVTSTVGIVTNTLNYVYDLAFAGADAGQLGGPIRIAQVSGEQAQQGFLNFLNLIAFLSTSIGLINLFPIPVLDGGHLMFYAVEGLRGRPVGEAAQRVGTMVGLSLVLLLMVFATYNDLLRL